MQSWKQLRRMPEHLRKLVERELKCYPLEKARLAKWKWDLAALERRFGSYLEQEAGGRLMELRRRIDQGERQVERIDGGLSALSGEERDLIKLRYFHRAGFNDSQALIQLCLYRTLYYRLKGRALYKLAVAMGEA
jgi:hypothetical protein